MNYREVEIQALQVVANSGTKTYDLDVTEPITELEVAIKVKNTDAVCEDVPPERIISKIEIVDGGAVWWSATGAEAVGISTYEKGRWPTTWLYEGASGNQRTWIPIQFGRYLGDEQYAFTAGKLSNPQLKITWAKNALHLTNQVEIGIFAKLMQGVAAPSQALMTKAVRTFTTVGSGEEPTDLPVDVPMRRLFIRGELTGYSITSIFDQYKLDCDLGKLIIFDLGQRKMIARCENEFGFFTYRKHDWADVGRYVRTWMGRTMGCSFDVTADGIFASGYTTSADFYYPSIYDHDGNPQLNVSGVALVYGSFPQYMLCYQFGRKEEPATWFNAAAFKKVVLKLEQGVADAAASILLQQPVTLRRS